MNSSWWYQSLHVWKSSFAIIVFSIYYKYSIFKPSDKISCPAYIVSIFSAFWYITFKTLNGLLSGPQKIVNEPISWILPNNHCAPLMQHLAPSWFCRSDFDWRKRKKSMPHMFCFRVCLSSRYKEYKWSVQVMYAIFITVEKFWWELMILAKTKFHEDPPDRLFKQLLT